MTTVRKLQRMIHVGCKQLGLDDDTRHDLQLAVTGKASLADMTDAELQKVVSALQQRGFKSGFTASSKGRRAEPRSALCLWVGLRTHPRPYNRVFAGH